MTWTFNPAPSSGTVWGPRSQQERVLNPVTGLNDQFGCAVALNGDGTVLAVGARLAGGASASVAGPGKAYVYLWDGSDWQLSGTFSGDANDDQFGWVVQLSTSGTELAVSAPFKDVGADADAGMVRGASTRALPRAVARSL